MVFISGEDWDPIDGPTARVDAERGATTSPFATRWLPSDWAPAAATGTSSSATLEQAQLSAQPTSRDEGPSPWLPAPGAASAFLGEPVPADPSQQRSAGSRGRVLIHGRRGVIGAGAIMSAVAAPVAIGVIGAPALSAVPVLAVIHAPRPTKPAASTRQHRYRVARRDAARRHARRLTLGVAGASRTRSVIVASTVTPAVRAPARSAARPVAVVTPVVHVTRPARAQATKAKPAGASTSSAAGTGSSPAPAQSPAQSAVATATQTASSVTSQVHLP